MAAAILTTVQNRQQKRKLKHRREKMHKRFNALGIKNKAN